MTLPLADRQQDRFHADQPAVNRPRVAVILVHWNQPLLLARCLQSLSEQTFQPSRIVVIDNGSGDRLALLDGDPRVELVRLEQNRGFAVAANLAIGRAADCPWIALLNPDTVVERRWLAALMQSASEHPGYACFASRLLKARQPAVADGAGDVYHTSGLAWRYGHGRPAAALPHAPRDVFSACAAAALFRRQAILDVGGLDESYFCYFEDVDLGFRLRLAGYRCLFTPDAVAYHVGSASSGPKSDFAIYHGHRNLVWTYWKNMPSRLCLVYLPQHLLMNLAALVWFTCRGQARAIWSAKWDALRGLGVVWRKRGQVRKLQVISNRQLLRAMASGWQRRSWK